MKRKKTQSPRRLEIAMRGAAAGVIGGAIVSLTQREVLARIAGGAPHHAQWDDVAGRGLQRIGINVTGGPRIAAGVTTQLLYAGALGACYAVLREEAKQSRAASYLVDAALTYAATLVFPEQPEPKRRRGKLAVRTSLARHANIAQAFNRATSMALQVLMR